jgi:glucose-fructose oxidoreductase
MSIDYLSARNIADCAFSKGVTLAVNWPIAWFPSFNKAKELCDSGRIGEIMRVTYRSPANWGPYSYSKDGQIPSVEELAKTWWYNKDRGGGSILDYACYGAALSTWFFGHRAISGVGIAKNFSLPGLEIEDFSAMMFDFGNGIGLLEGSWSTYNCGEIPSGPIIHGKEGTIVCDRYSNKVKLYIGRSHTLVAPTEVIECPQSITDFNFGRNMLDQLTKGTPLHPMLEPEFNVSVMSALDAGRKSAQTGSHAYLM